MLFLLGSIIFLFASLGIFTLDFLAIELNERFENLSLIFFSFCSGFFFNLFLKNKNFVYKEKAELISKEKLKKEVLKDENEQLKQKIKTLESALDKISG